MTDTQNINLLVEYANQKNPANGEKLKAVLEDANKHFEKFGAVDNKHMLVHVLMEESVTYHIAKWLDRNEEEGNWPLEKEDELQQDVAFMVGANWFPTKPPELRKRWFILLYIASALIQNFDHKNLFDGTEYHKKETPLK